MLSTYSFIVVARTVNVVSELQSCCWPSYTHPFVILWVDVVVVSNFWVDRPMGCWVLKARLLIVTGHRSDISVYTQMTRMEGRFVEAVNRIDDTESLAPRTKLPRRY